MHQSDASALRSEDSDSIMTDEVEVVATASPRVGGRAGERQLVLEDNDQDEEDEDEEAAPVASTSDIPIGAEPSSSTGLPSSPRPATPNAGVEVVGTTSSHSANLRPGPVCEFGDRLAYTYFKKPVPTEAQLNAAYAHTPTYWFTIDDDLTYLSFFKDTGPVSGLCIISPISD